MIPPQVKEWLDHKNIPLTIQDRIGHHYSGFQNISRVGQVDLTGIQFLIIAFNAMGLNDKRIAFLMGTSTKTTQHHNANLRSKLSVSCKIGMTHFAIVNGMIVPGQYIVD